ncbi:MAG: hypothetical protein ABIM74_01140 [candidate division WOR-3 bacterium]
MAKAQLSGKMLRLNGSLSQYLQGTTNITLSAFWVRITIRANWNNEVTECYPFWWYCSPNIYIQHYGYLAYNRQIIAVGQGRSNTIYPYYTGGTSTASHGAMTIDMVYDGSAIAWYLNGVRSTIASTSGNINALNSALYIGRAPGGYYYRGDIGHVIIHNAVPGAFSGFPDHLSGIAAHPLLKATEFLKYIGLTENDVLCLYDYRDPNNPGKNYGFGGSNYDLTPYNNPSVIDTDCQYEIIDEIPLIATAWLDCEYSPAQRNIGNFLFHAQATGGVEPYSYQWYVSTDEGNTWTPTGDTADLYVWEAPPGLYWCRVRITDNDNNEAYSQIVKVLVYTCPSQIIEYPHGITLKGHMEVPRLRGKLRCRL